MGRMSSASYSASGAQPPREFTGTGQRRCRAGLHRAAATVSLLDAAPPQRKPSIAWRLRHAEELATGNFPDLWRDVTGADAG
jgi:hypothetical protein